MRRQWNNEQELAEQMLVLANRKERVILSPETAYYVAIRLMKAGAKPTRDEIAKELCDSKCSQPVPCYGCRGKANIVVRLYGVSGGRAPD